METALPGIMNKCCCVVFALARLPSQQPLVNGGEREQFEQQPDGQREEDEGEGLDKQMEADVKQRTGQLLRGEAVSLHHCRATHVTRTVSNCASPPSSATGRC